MSISSIIDSFIGLLDKLQSFQVDIKKQISAEIKRTQRKIILSLSRFILYATGILLIVAGAIIFFSRFFPADVVMIVSGLIVLYIAFMVGLIRK